MKHRKNIISLFLLLLAWVLPVTAAASTTTLSTSVPANVSLTVEIAGKGTVWVGNQKLAQTGTVFVPRHDQIQISLRPNQGYEVASVLLNGVNITSQMKNGNLTLKMNGADQTLAVEFVRTENQLPKPDFPEMHPDFSRPIIWWMKSVKKFLWWMFCKM